LKLLLEKLQTSVRHLQCLDKILGGDDEYKRIETLLHSPPYDSVYQEISKELYAGGKQPRGRSKLARQMILGDVIEYIFSGRAYYFAAKSDDNLKAFLKLILYSVNQLLLYDVITVRPNLRKKYIIELENTIPLDQLYEKEGDKELARRLKADTTKWNDDNWGQYDQFIDSILPKTLGCPKELVVFAELVRLKKGVIIPLLLIQRVFGGKETIAPPDFLLLGKNKNIFGIELGYAKEGQSRTFSIETSIPTIAVDLKNNMHNRCPKCGENILYCDPVIDLYSSGHLDDYLVEGKFNCKDCSRINGGNCGFSNYYGKLNGASFNGKQIGINDHRHYHAKCVLSDSYIFNRQSRRISSHVDEFFAQIPKIEGIEGI
jgi:hypothetical protein